MRESVIERQIRGESYQSKKIAKQENELLKIAILSVLRAKENFPTWRILLFL